MNNPSLDRLMMEASAAAYAVSVTDPANHIATLTGGYDRVSFTWKNRVREEFLLIFETAEVAR